jgi:hypothetical protein
MGRRVIEGVDPNFKSAFSDDGRHSYATEGLGFLASRRAGSPDRWDRAFRRRLLGFSRTPTAWRMATCPICPYRFALRAVVAGLQPRIDATTDSGTPPSSKRVSCAVRTQRTTVIVGSLPNTYATVGMTSLLCISRRETRVSDPSLRLSTGETGRVRRLHWQQDSPQTIQLRESQTAMARDLCL